jgi:hypothetical protein
MQTIAFSFSHLTDAQLLTEVHSLVARERQTTARLIASLAEFETRGLDLRDGCQSLFTYCTQRLHLSEAEAYSRIGAARTARKWPLVLELLADGSSLKRIVLNARGRLRPDRVTCQRPSGARFGREMRAAAHSWAPADDAPSAVSLSFTT